MDRRMNWGCGPVKPEGWVNVDNATDPDWVDESIVRWTHTFNDASFDGIVANHSLQCLTYDKLDDAVQEFHRLLRPGGRLRVLVPDVFRAVAALDYQEDDWPGFVAITEPWSLERKACHYITWGGQNRSVFTEYTLVDLMERNGLEPSDQWWTAHAAEVRDGDHEWEWLRTLDSRLGESIVMEFVKP